MNPLQALWQQIMAMRGGGAAGPNPMAANPAMNPAGTPMAGAGMPGAPMGGSGFSLMGDAPPAGQFGTNLLDAANPANFSLTGPGMAGMGGGAPTTQFGANVNPAMAPSTAAPDPSGLTQPSPNAMAQAMKLAQYAAASQAMQKMMQQQDTPDRTVRREAGFRGSGSTGTGFDKFGRPAPSPVGPTPPPPGPVSSAGMFLLSPAGKAAMNRLQSMIQPGVMAA